ncbi:hypothetical protein DL96DRAFT_1627261 [Flagelloscypha sp. PMI_526]|nr:hypothetical protein DL96DRAFT_1627261 [Flagelloscypha sp. PMI_526]
MSFNRKTTSPTSIAHLSIDIARGIIELAAEIKSVGLKLSLVSKQVQIWYRSLIRFGSVYVVLTELTRSDPALFWHIEMGDPANKRFEAFKSTFLSSDPHPSERLLRARNLVRVLTVSPSARTMSAPSLIQCVRQCPNIQQIFYNWHAKEHSYPDQSLLSLTLPNLSSLYITVNAGNMGAELKSPLFQHLRHLDLSEQYELGKPSVIPFWQSLPNLKFLETLTLEWRAVEPPFPYTHILDYVPPSFRVLIVVWGLTWNDYTPSPGRDEIVRAVREGDVDERIVLGQDLSGGSKDWTWVVKAYEEPGEKLNIWRPPILRREWEAIYKMAEDRKRWRRSKGRIQ